MPAGREGKRGGFLFFALPLLNFLGPGGVFFRADLYNRRRGAFGICIPAYREGERTELLFGACAVSFSRSGEVFSSTDAGGAFGMCMPARRG